MLAHMKTYKMWMFFFSFLFKNYSASNYYPWKQDKKEKYDVLKA